MNNDLISREALKKEFTERINANGFMTTEELLGIIDNAPTVEPEVKKVPIASVTFDTEKLKELTDEIVERIKSGEIVLQDERPQVEWGKWVISEIRCPNCLEYFQTDCYSAEELKKCPNCGADMRGKEK